MTPITIKLPDEVMAEYKRRAATAKMKPSAYLRDQLLGVAPPEPEPNRATIENEIDGLKKEIERLNETVLKMTKSIATIAKFNREMLFQSIADYCGEEVARSAIAATDEVMTGKRKALTIS